MTSLNDEARKSVQDAVDALRQWRSEIDAVNKRGLASAMDRMAAAQQALGWPNRVTAETGPSAVLPGKIHYFMVLDAVREQLLKSSKEDMRVIDKVAEACYASLLPQITFSPQTSASPPAGSDGAAPTEAQKRSKLPIFVATLVALGAIGYTIYDRSVKSVSTAVDSGKSVDGAGTNHSSGETAVPSEPSIPPAPQQTVITPKPEQTAPTPQSATTPESPRTMVARNVAVELGALASQQQATRKWRELQRRSPDTFAGHVPGMRKVKLRGSTVWLLEIQDFPDNSTAVAFCESVHRKGAQCDIRETK
jgi:hypothetical protein